MPSIQKQPIKVFLKHIASLDGELVQFPVKYIPDDITTGIEDAQTTANTAKNTAEAAQSTANKAFRIYQKVEDVTISIPELRESNSSATSIGDANIAYGSVITLSAKYHTGTAIWNGNSVYINTVNSVGVMGPSILLTLKPNGEYEIRNNSRGTILGESTLAYKKVVVPEVAYSIWKGAWLPPYTICSRLYIAGQRSNSGYPIYKMTIGNTGIPSFTDMSDPTNKFTPVAQSELAEKQDVLTDSDKQSIVKTGMTSGAAWTDAERLAALQRLGCTVGEDGIVRWTAQTGG